MEPINIFIAVISSSVLASLITSLFIKKSKDKSDELKYITNERKQWRDDLREATVALRRLFEDKNKEDDINNLKFKSYVEAKVYYQIRFNPNDIEDNKILEQFDNLDEDNLKIIEKGIARLLKHDWERVKKETKPKNWYITFITVMLILFLLFYFYPIKEWFGMTENVKSNIFSINALILEFFSAKTFFLLVLLPVAFKLLLGLKLLFLKTIKIIPKATSKKSLICSWLNIPYRETIEPKEAKNGKNN